MCLEPYSVLMSVYNKTTVSELSKSVESMLEQTVKPEQFVIVCDGPVRDEVMRKLREYEANYPSMFTLVLLEKNCGLAYALNQGIEVARNELIARMDSDDISLPRRCEIQLKAFQGDQELTLLGTSTMDFSDVPEHAVPTVSPCPESMDEIKKMLRRNDPFAHPTVMYKKSVVLACGGYDPLLRRRQDYDLFSKMVNRGYKAGNIDEPLLLYRVDDNNFERLRSKETCDSRILVQKRIYDRGECSFWDYMYIVLAMKVTRILPMALYKSVYRRLKSGQKKHEE